MYGIPVPKEETDKMIYIMDHIAEPFDNLIKEPYHPPVPQTPNKQQLLDSINPNMKLTESFFKRIYAYEVTWPGFAEMALKKLEEAGSTRARGYYEQFSRKYEEEYNNAMKAGGEYLLKQREQERQQKERKKVRKWKMTESFQKESDEQLLMRWQKLNQSIQE